MEVLSYIVSRLLFGLPYLIGIVVIGAMARGSARVLGVIGCVVLLISYVLGAVWSYLLPQLVRDLDLSIALASVPSAIFGAVGAVGMILVICAVVAGRRKPLGPPMQQQQVYPQQPPAQPSQPSYGQPHAGPYQPGQQ